MTVSTNEAKYKFSDILGDTPSINRAKGLARQVAPTSVNVLLIGESGTGKEMFAQSIHNQSKARNGAFISLNCAVIPRDIAESELFGYGKGAFTGALKEGKKGKLELANNGTLFLDEIVKMPLELQAKLLWVLESRTMTRLGENDEIPVNFRLIAASNKDLPQLGAENKFREDLYCRIAVTTIYLPSLHQSKDDIPKIFINFVE